ncbi:hypothetical protein BDY19DRAFT_994682 [Irpex rosettiformis]|uniref:Uncharacterized protein n=1 Tax=Irpex rosettiformis TaxID=378272 RepID=A0ACB8U1B4_9APHY|nr:hypothetical protein BDY19DRAFT_994682 [Irpex rosettiformis]
MGTNPLSAFEVLTGPMLILICFALMLFGVFSAQCYFYWFAYESDPRILRITVLALWFFEACHTSFCFTFYTAALSNTLVTQFMEWNTSFGAPVFYIHRIYRLSGSVIIAAIPAVFLVTRVVLGFVLTAYLYIFDTWVSFRSHPFSGHILDTSISVGVVTDVMITAQLIYYLRRRRSRVTRTRHIVQRLQRNIVNNGALAVIISAATLVALHAAPNSLFFAGLVEIMSKVYANSVVATLNSRRSISKYGDSFGKDGVNNIELSNVRADTSRDSTLLNESTAKSEDTRSPTHTNNVSIMFTKTTETFVV